MTERPPHPDSFLVRRRAARARKARSGRSRGRLAILWVATFIGFSALVLRAVTLQASPSPRLQQEREEAREQRLTEVTLPAERGSFFDRNGVELAISVEQTTIVANAKSVADPVAAANVLAPVLGKDPAVLAQLLASNQSFVYLARTVDDATAAAVEQIQKEHKYDFLSYLDEPKRFYPSGNELALSVLGRTDPEGNGISGLERQLDETLKGTDGSVVSERGTRNRTIPGGQQQVTAAVPGTSYVLSIDRALQYEVEKILKRVVDEQAAKGATAIVMNPHTGEVLADVNVVREEGGSAREASENRALTWTFEPGSINKTLTLSGVLNEGLATPDTERVISAKIASYEMEFTDEGRSSDLVMTPTEILRVSSNNGTVTWAEDLGKDKLRDYFQRFGLGKTTGLGFPGEAGGTLRPLKNWDDVSFRTMAYGLGVSVTPMQMLSAYNTIANGGVSAPPRLVLGEQDADGVFTPSTAPAGDVVVSAETAAGMTNMLTTVVAGGTGKNAQVAGFSVAGKTGTAWKALESGGYGYPGARRYVASFAGFLPASDPQLSIIVVIDEPTDQTATGGKTAAPVFSEIASFAVRQLRIPPDLDAATPTSNKERVRAQPQGNENTPRPVLGPPAPTSTTTTTTPKPTTTVKAAPTTTAAKAAPTTTAAKAAPTTTAAKAAPTTTAAKAAPTTTVAKAAPTTTAAKAASAAAATMGGTP